MKFYIASHSSNVYKVREAMAYVRSQGHEITCDWTQHIQALNEGHLSVPAWKICREDILGVDEAAAVIYLHTDKPSAGAWFEIGLAVGKGIPVAAIVGEQTKASMAALLDRFIFLNCQQWPTMEHSRFFIYQTIEEYLDQVRLESQHRRELLS
ncbi:MAG: hypothetical protein E6R03_06205 [Hyphomicrobiaceae bacterium]|nr:MAG: hypothetical protein E6R03_06205 [Hyphomicrobiaceae bacterium]